MKKIAAGVFIILILFAVEVTYINYRLEQKLDSIKQNQQNILTKVYSLERTTTQVNQTIQQVLQKQNSYPNTQQNYLFTTTDSKKIDLSQKKQKVIN